MSETEVDMDDTELPDDESTIDPELTSAADTGWLAEMRATAKGRRQTLAEALDADAETSSSETESDAFGGDTEPDDEMTIAGTDAFAEIRAAAAAARAASEPVSVTETESAPESAPTDVAAPPTEAIAREAAAPPDLHQPPEPPAPLSPSSERVPTTSQAQTATSSRWEPPQRLSTAKTPDTPVLSLTEKSGPVLDWKFAVAGVIVALLLGFLVARLLTGEADPVPVDPDGDVVTTIAAGGPDQ